MKNIERLTKCIAKEGSNHVLIHSIWGSKNWIVCQKIAENQWLLTMMDPLGNVTYNLGIVSDADHIALWKELVKTEMEERSIKNINGQRVKKENI